jgi:hypothetical protein
VTPATWVEALVALATAAMAITTAYMASKTASAASATRDDAKASQRAAEAAEASVAAARDTLDEIRRGRELEWRPHLSITVPTSKVSGADQVSFDFLAMNLGRGPALQCVCVYMDNRRGAVSGVFEVRPSDREQGHGQTDTAADQYLGDLFAVPDRLPVRTGWVAICWDGLFGYWYRFRPSSVNPDVWTLEEPVPKWVTAIQGTVPDLAR